MSEHTVGEVARLAGVSVRTLHHYDEIGLLPPSGRSESGYRLYSAADVERLRRILFYRELDFPLEEIARILAEPDARADDHLRRQHRMLRTRIARDTKLLRALEHEMEARKMGIALTAEEQLEVFGRADLERDEAEARQRWGDSAAFEQSQRRTVGYTKDDWVAIKHEADEVTETFARALRAGEPADGQLAREAAEAHRQHIARWFYDCDHAMHRRLAELYVSEQRFAATYDAIAPGLARYVHDAICANATRGGSSAA